MIATQDYGWSQLATGSGRTWPEATDWAMRLAAGAGFAGWEPFVATPADMDRIALLAARHGLNLLSIFVSGPLHDPAKMATTEARILDICRSAAGHGCRFVMIYPAGAPKSDDELTTQARALDRIAGALQPLGLTLCYHPEEPEMRLAAHEFHHMMLGTDPALVRLCLDPDTNWRGAGGSMLAVLDVVRLYGARTVALHIRQSQGGIWAETVGEGDLAYPLIVQALRKAGARPLLVVEHAYDPATPRTLDPVTAHRRSCDYVRTVLLPILEPL